jgi:hypothetical protein
LILYKDMKYMFAKHLIILIKMLLQHQGTKKQLIVCFLIQYL